MHYSIHIVLKNLLNETQGWYSVYKNPVFFLSFVCSIKNVNARVWNGNDDINTKPSCMGQLYSCILGHSNQIKITVLFS